jgi:hypothetical protein
MQNLIGLVAESQLGKDYFRLTFEVRKLDKKYYLFDNLNGKE